MTAECVFCDIVAGRLHAEILFEDERTVAFLDNTAVMEGHTLVIPRAHAADIWEIPEDDAAAVMRTVHRMAAVLDGVLKPDGLTLFQANRPAGWQDVFHLHVHLVPREDADRLNRPWYVDRADPEALARTRRRILGEGSADALR
ncbi:HIT domain-containing protein [Streptomyces cinnabarinus]|uniref:HIT domain-containing protein n=1 Tax=Streptomyces cinnabarinus TaxID=67287 RepID=A0ABY7KMK9_9ACTN|nr:HIT domain-containing protein [Streptomyces cinnabarinus]WAZ24798.1 HIT domain-containing protein [Streptomyces cinnabarinus]